MIYDDVRDGFHEEDLFKECEGLSCTPLEAGSWVCMSFVFDVISGI